MSGEPGAVAQVQMTAFEPWASCAEQIWNEPKPLNSADSVQRREGRLWGMGRRRREGNDGRQWVDIVDKVGVQSISTAPM
jgi:hypothetical protein